MTPRRICLITAPTALTGPATANASERHREIRDWRVQVESTDTGEDLRLTCSARTGGDGDPVLAVDMSDGNSGQTVATAGLDSEGFAEAFAAFDGSRSRLMLEGMRHAGQLEILAPAGIVLTASLNGFTAAYDRIAEQCGFSTTGVID